MSLNRLKDISIKQAKPKEKDYTLNDGGGLIAYIKRDGTKQWIFRYTYNGKRKKTTFGTYPTTTLENARNKRTEYLNTIANNIDPIEQNKQIKAETKAIEINKNNPETTVGYLFNRYLELKKHNKNLPEETIDKERNRLKRHFYPYLPHQASTQIKNLTYEDMVKTLKLLEEKNILETLGRVKSSLLNLLNFAYSDNILEDGDIITKLRAKIFKKVHKKDVKNSPALTKPEEIKNLIIGINNYQGEIYTKFALLFSMHTAQRQGSITSAEWEEIDFENKLWKIPDHKMKMKIKHTVPLSKQVVQMLYELQKVSGDKTYLFPNTQYKSRHMSENTVNNALRRLGYTNEEIVAHGFRSMFSTICNEYLTTHNIPYDIIEKALAHKDENEIRAAYNRAKNLDDLKRLMQWWSDYLDRLFA
jgi:integrase